MQVQKDKNPQEFKDRLSERMEELHLNQSDLARDMGIGQSTVNRWREGTKPQPRMMVALAAALSVRVDWLANGIGEKFPFDAHLDKLKQTSAYAQSVADAPEQAQRVFEERYEAMAPTLPSGSKANIFFVPLVTWNDAVITFNYDELVAKAIDVVPTVCSDAKAFAVPQDGDSMETRVLNGDIAVVMPSEEPRAGCLVLAKFKAGDMMLRRFVSNPDGKIRLIPYNSLYPTFEHKRSDFLWLHPVHSTFRREWT